MTILKLAVAAAIAATALSGTAHAAEIITGPPDNPNKTTLQVATFDPGSNNSFSIGFTDSNLANPFTELLTFTTDVMGTLSITVSTTATSALNDVDFSNVFLTGSGIMGAISIPQVLGEPGETRQLNGINVGAGTFTLAISGSPGTQSGALGGSVAFQGAQAAVPEPGTWALMLAGFGAIGFSMRRRRRGSFIYQAA